jgi:hypothetical protein
MFLAIRTRPDILKEVIFLSTFMTNPGPIAHNKLYHLVGYLRGTPSLGIRFKVRQPFISVYADASFATHLNGRSHSGVVITLGANGMINRKFKLSFQLLRLKQKS